MKTLDKNKWRYYLAIPSLMMTILSWGILFLEGVLLTPTTRLLPQIEGSLVTVGLISLLILCLVGIDYLTNTRSKKKLPKILHALVTISLSVGSIGLVILTLYSFSGLYAGSLCSHMINGETYLLIDEGERPDSLFILYQKKSPLTMTRLASNAELAQDENVSKEIIEKMLQDL